MGSSFSGGHKNNRLANFLFLWAANAAGAAELVLVNPFLGLPTAIAATVVFDYDDYRSFLNYEPTAQWMRTIALVYTCYMLAYVGFVMTLSAFSMNIAPLRVAEDLWLLGLTVFACYTLVLDRRFYKAG